MLKEPQSPRYATPRTHRTYSAQFKADTVAACMVPGTSISAVALQHGMNTNVLHRWLKEFRQGLHRQGGAATQPMAQPAMPAAFVPVDMTMPAPATALGAPVQDRAAPAAPTDIRIECHRADLRVTVHWPVSDAAQCARMLRELLR